MAVESLTSWTDDIPICREAGIGTANNEIYRKDGRRAEMHPMQNRSFHFSQEELGLSLYGLFDGFNGHLVSDFAMKRMPAELLLGQLSHNSLDEAVRDILRAAFTIVDREFFESTMASITRRIVLKQDPSVSGDDPALMELEAQAAIGASSTVAVVTGGKLFVAGCGDTRAVLCIKTPGGDIKMLKLSVDHVLGNEDEDLRLRQLGLRTEDMERGLSNPGYTRCLGFHKGKGGYKEEDTIRLARDEPVIADPEISGPINIEPSFQFLLLFSRSVTDCLSQVSSCDGGDSALELCRITMDQFAENTTVSGVAQSVVHKIVRMHQEQFEMTEAMSAASVCNTRDDLSLLVRRFHAKLSSTRRKRSSHGNLSGGEGVGNNNNSNGGSGNGVETPSRAEDTMIPKMFPIHPPHQPNNPRPGPGATLSSTATEESQSSSTSDGAFATKTSAGRELPLDEQGRIKPYVDFSHFHREYAKFNKQQAKKS